MSKAYSETPNIWKDQLTVFAIGQSRQWIVKELSIGGMLDQDLGAGMIVKWIENLPGMWLNVGHTPIFYMAT